MPVPTSQTLSRLVLATLCLVLGFACKSPETALRERPAQRVELVLDVTDATSEDARIVTEEMTRGLGVVGDGKDVPPKVSRVFHLTLHGTKNRDEGRGLGATWVASASEGLVIGFLFPISAAPPVGVVASPICAGLGLLVGIGYGPTRFDKNQTLLKEKGYLPWVFLADWEVRERGPGGLDASVAETRNTHLDIRPFLRPLPPEDRSEAAARRASLRAYVEALVHHFKPKQE